MNSILEYSSVFQKIWTYIICLELLIAFCHYLPYTLSILVLWIVLWLYIFQIFQQNLAGFGVLIKPSDHYRLTECFINLLWLWILICLNLFLPLYFVPSICLVILFFLLFSFLNAFLFSPHFPPYYCGNHFLYINFSVLILYLNVYP